MYFFCFLVAYFFFFLFFFFQAEDGIRDGHVTGVQSVLFRSMLALGVWMATTVFARALKKQSISRATFIIFSWLQVFTACAFAFSHGANDIANAVEIGRASCRERV